MTAYQTDRTVAHNKLLCYFYINTLNFFLLLFSHIPMLDPLINWSVCHLLHPPLCLLIVLCFAVLLGAILLNLLQFLWHSSLFFPPLKQPPHPPPQPLLAHMPCRHQHHVQPCHLPLLLIFLPPINKTIKPLFSSNGFTNNVVRVGDGAPPPPASPSLAPQLPTDQQ